MLACSWKQFVVVVVVVGNNLFRFEGKYAKCQNAMLYWKLFVQVSYVRSTVF
jgi:hypothetical protein